MVKCLDRFQVFFFIVWHFTSLFLLSNLMGHPHLLVLKPLWLAQVHLIAKKTGIGSGSNLRGSCKSNAKERKKMQLVWQSKRRIFLSKNTRSPSPVQTDCFSPFPTLLALTDQFMKSYFNLIEPNSVFTAFGLMTPNRGTTEDDFFSALIFSSYDEVNTRIGWKPVSICFFFLCKSFGFFVLTREKKNFFW